MAKDERPNAAEKGKGKVDDVRELNGDKKESKEGKPLVNGKKDDEPKEGVEAAYFPRQPRWRLRADEYRDARRSQ